MPTTPLSSIESMIREDERKTAEEKAERRRLRHERKEEKARRAEAAAAAETAAVAAAKAAAEAEAERQKAAARKEEEEERERLAARDREKEKEGERAVRRSAQGRSSPPHEEHSSDSLLLPVLPPPSPPPARPSPPPPRPCSPLRLVDAREKERQKEEGDLSTYAERVASLVRERLEDGGGSGGAWFACSRRKSKKEGFHSLLVYLPSHSRYFWVRFKMGEEPPPSLKEAVYRSVDPSVRADQFKKFQLTDNNLFELPSCASSAS